MGALALTLAVLASFALAVLPPPEFVASATSDARISRFALSLLVWVALAGLPQESVVRSSPDPERSGDRAKGRALVPLAWLLSPCALALGLDLVDGFSHSRLLEIGGGALGFLLFASFAAQRGAGSISYGIAWLASVPLPVALSCALGLSGTSVGRFFEYSPLGWLIERSVEVPPVGWTIAKLSERGAAGSIDWAQGALWIPFGVGSALLLVASLGGRTDEVHE